MHKSLIIISFSLCVFSVSSQQSSLLEKYRSMAVSYNHDLKAADKNPIAPDPQSSRFEKDLKPKPPNKKAPG